MWVKQKVSHNVTTICPLNGDWIFFSELKIHFHFFHSVQRSCMVTWESSFVEPCFTRLHTSRMHTARLLTISPSMHCTGGSAPGGVPGPGGVRSGGVNGPRWSASGGGAWSGGGGIPACTEADPHPVNRILDTRYWANENITFPQTSFEGGKYLLVHISFGLHFKRNEWKCFKNSDLQNLS